MAMNKRQIEVYISEAFPDATFELIDLAGDDNHWALHISAVEFEGKSRIQQHRMVYQALEGNMGQALHALQIKTSLPET